jgi:hypothetical protein
MAELRTKTSVSWLNYCPSEETTTANEDVLTFWGMFVPPEIPESDGDIEHVIRAGERLDALALTYYRDEQLSWVIAVRNGMDLPDAQMVIGATITVPDPQVVLTQIVTK